MASDGTLYLFACNVGRDHKLTQRKFVATYSLRGIDLSYYTKVFPPGQASAFANQLQDLGIFGPDQSVIAFDSYVFMPSFIFDPLDDPTEIPNRIDLLD